MSLSGPYCELSGGRTRLEGRTFYDVQIFPAAYWSLWSNALVHAIHERVLGHIKSLSEGGDPVSTRATPQT